MEQILHLAQTIYIQYTNEMVLGLLACILILMIITLTAVRKCRRQVRVLNDKTKDMLKLALSQRETTAKKENQRTGATLQTDRRGYPVSGEDEELFGSVIQEIFS